MIKKIPFQKKVYLMMFALLFSALVHGQMKVSGVITDASDSSPLPGVNVIIKGTTIGTVSDFDGNYSLDVQEANSTLVYSFIGYLQEEFVITESGTLDIALVLDLAELDEVVVVGYGTQKKKEITGAVASIKSEDILKTASSDFTQSLQGQVAGVSVQASSGRPGDKANIQIRGLGSLSTNALSPLYIVDGIPYDGNPNLAPEEISSMEILKDGAAASVYGTRASNGVILITTNRGKKGEAKVKFSSYYGVQNITSQTPLMGTSEQLYLEEIRAQAEGSTSLILADNGSAMRYDSDFVGYATNNNAPIQNYNMNISGGQENLTLSLNTNYFKQDGILINSGYERLTGRLNAGFTKGKFNAFASVGVNLSTQDVEPFGLYEYAIFQKPWKQTPDAFIVDGPNVTIPGENPDHVSGFSQRLTNDDRRQTNATNGAMNLSYEIVEGLKYQINLGGQISNYHRKLFEPQYIVFDQKGNPSASATREDARLTEEFQTKSKYTMENLLTFQKSFGKHNLNLLGGYTMEQSNFKLVNTQMTNFLSNDTPVFSAGSTAAGTIGYDSETTLVGLLGRVQYNYASKYLFSASVRRDGSSRFSPSNRYGVFPGFSAGWNIDQEEFIKNSVALAFISSLKIRGSWAEVGNQNISDYLYSAYLESNIDYPFGPEGQETLANGALQRAYIDENIKWETNLSKNIGFDLGMFDGKFVFNGDFYINSKQDMLLKLELPPSTGTAVPYDTQNRYNAVLSNVGDMTNKGIELAATYKQQTKGDLKWSLTGTFTKNVNEVTDLGPYGTLAFGGGGPVLTSTTDDNTTFLAKGYEAGSFFLIPTNGVIKTAEQLADYQKINPNARYGDLIYRDTDGNGKITDEDREYMGSGMAKFETGLIFNADFRGLDLFVQLYYSHGAKIYNGSKMYAYAQGRHSDMYSMWTLYNSDSDIAPHRGSDTHDNVRARSDQYLEDGSYFRIRNVTLGYTLPKAWFNNHVEKLRLYSSIQNPLTLTKYTGYDPEVGGDGIFSRGVDSGSYPVSRQFLFGVQLDF